MAQEHAAAAVALQPQRVHNLLSFFAFLYSLFKLFPQMANGLAAGKTAYRDNHFCFTDLSLLLNALSSVHSIFEILAEETVKATSP